MTDWFREGAGTVTTNNKEPIDQVCIWELMPPHLFGEKFHKNKISGKEIENCFLWENVVLLLAIIEGKCINCIKEFKPMGSVSPP